MLRSTVLFPSFDEQNFTDMTFSKVFRHYVLQEGKAVQNARDLYIGHYFLFEQAQPYVEPNSVIFYLRINTNWWKHPHSTIVTLVRTLRLLLEIFTSTPVTPLCLNSNTYWMQEHSFRGRGEGLLMEVKTVYKPLKVKHTLIWHNFTGLHLLNRTIYSSVDAT